MPGPPQLVASRPGRADAEEASGWRSHEIDAEVDATWDKAPDFLTVRVSKTARRTCGLVSRRRRSGLEAELRTAHPACASGPRSVATSQPFAGTVT
jgi:hypothetical protein